jgi:hypothetical protein
LTEDLANDGGVSLLAKALPRPGNTKNAQFPAASGDIAEKLNIYFIKKIACHHFPVF